MFIGDIFKKTAPQTALAQSVYSAPSMVSLPKRGLHILASVDISDAEDIAHRIMKGRAVRAYSTGNVHVFTLYTRKPRKHRRNAGRNYVWL
jgi:hypothetical protein